MDKYEAFGLLGEGSFGRVYKAKRNEDGIFVALKVISKVCFCICSTHTYIISYT